MSKNVVSILRHAIGEPTPTDLRLRVNAYAVTRDVDLMVVLTDCSVELATKNSQAPERHIGEVTFPSSSTERDITGLIESGIPVLALSNSLDEVGLGVEHLVSGVKVIDLETLANLIVEADIILTW